ncbi:HTH-type transcriptional repressor KstR [Rhodobiaceae bacterium]|nr:HTH-type transcriptional repressor KstR [Rhodobiaceae bacterium]
MSVGASENLSITGQPSRRSRKKEQTRRGIFAAAMKLFADHDYDAVTIEDICDRADVAKATFFLHFPNKAALLTEFNERLTANLQERLINVSGSAEDKLRFMVSALVDDWEQNAQIMRKMVREFLNQPSLPEAATEANEGLLDLITNIVREGQQAREFGSKVAPDLVAAALVASWGSFVSAWSNNREDIPKSAGEDLLDIMLNGLKT